MRHRNYGDRVTDQNDAASRALNALEDGITVVPGDADHPPYDTLEAFVDGRLDAVDSEIAESHLAVCTQCADDVEDLRAVRRDITPLTTPRAPRWWMPAAAAAAAAVALTVWISRSTSPSTEPQDQVVAATPSVTTAPALAPPADPLSAVDRALVDRVRSAGRLEVPASIATLRGTQGTLLGRSADTVLVPLAPLGTAVVSARPSFSWHPVKGAQAYSVAVYDDRFTEVTRSPRVSGTSWVATKDLPRDRALSWQVTAHLNGADIVGPAPPQPEARFKVIDQATANSIAGLREHLASRPLELGILLAKQGLLADAAEQLRRAESEPATSATAKALLSSLP